MVTEYNAEFTYWDKDEYEFNIWITFSETIERDLDYEQRELLSIDDFEAISRGRDLHREEGSDVWVAAKEAVRYMTLDNIQEVDYS
tara:strand:+ start:127 stop:384 length:258 start_codon:yes stop_codon:yes gene_type:complete